MLKNVSEIEWKKYKLKKKRKLKREKKKHYSNKQYFISKAAIKSPFLIQFFY